MIQKYFLFGHRLLLACWLFVASAGYALAQRTACGARFSCTVHPDGTLWGWGTNNLGQLGLGTFSAQELNPVQIGTATTWQSVAAGYTHTVALRTDGSLWTWGSNTSGQLGDGTTTTRSSPARVGTSTWKAIAAGSSETFAIRSDGTLWAWGNNSFGQLGDGTTVSRVVPTQIGAPTTWQSVAGGGLHTLAIRSDGTLWT